MLKTMAIEAGFDKTKNISNHSARKHLVQKLRDSNIAPTEIMQITGHKNVKSIINYSEISEQTQKRCSNLLASCSTATPSQASVSCTSVNASEMNISLPTHPAQAQLPGQNPIHGMFFGAVLNVQNLNIYAQPPQ